MKGKKMRLKGSYTVEAAVIVSLYLMMTAAVMKAGIDLYSEITGEKVGYREAVHPVQTFYRLETLEELGEEIKGGMEQ